MVVSEERQRHLRWNETNHLHFINSIAASTQHPKLANWDVWSITHATVISPLKL